MSQSKPNQLKLLQPPTTPDPLEAPVLNWGILGTGWIAQKFVTSLQAGTRQRVVAVGSRTEASGRAFSGEFGPMTVHVSYADLVADPEVDVVYVATPHRNHAADARLALEAGKHVLIEKPLALTGSQAREIQQLTERTGLFAMEAFWTLFLPRFDVVRQALAAGLLGTIHAVVADNNEWFPPEHRIMDPALDGGPMLDLGVYPIGLATWVLGEHATARALGVPVPAGLARAAQAVAAPSHGSESSSQPASVNGQTAAVLGFESGALASIHTSILGGAPGHALIIGDQRTLELPGPFYMPGDVILRANTGEELERWSEPNIRHAALHFEAAEVARCIAAGQRESPLRPLRDSIRTLDAVDAIRAQTGAEV